MALTNDYSGRTLHGQKRDYHLEAPLHGGSGGEGCIYTLKGDSSLVAKIYHEDRYVKAPHDRAYQKRKLEAMLKLKFDPRYQDSWCFAWPQDILLDQGRMVGYVMPRINTRYMLNSVYNDTRAQMFPHWTWRTMTQVAYNLSVNIASLHRSGIVAGDLNPANMMVDPRNHLVVMIDCDSYDVYDPDTQEHFPCMVGTAEVLAPELQMVGDLSSPKARFTKESDCFSLAVLIFKLLMNGYDPFAKRSLNPNRSSAALTGANVDILTGASIYVKQIPGKARPVGAPDFSILPQEIQDLFRKVFLYGPYPDFMQKIALRPSAAQWCAALDRMYLSMDESKGQMVKCRVNEHHLYPKGLSSCPWCRAQKELDDAMKQMFPNAPAAQTLPAGPAGSPGGTPATAGTVSGVQRSPWLFLFLMAGCSILGAVLFGPAMADSLSVDGLGASDMQLIIGLVGCVISTLIAAHYWKRYPGAASVWPYWMFGLSMILLAPLTVLVLAGLIALVLEILKIIFLCIFALGLLSSLCGG